MRISAAKLLVFSLALTVSPLHVASSITAHAAAMPVAPLAERLASLPAPLTEAEFFERINAGNPYGYMVGAQGTQAMVISINVSVPGHPSSTSDAGASPVSPLDSFFDSPVASSGGAGTATDDAPDSIDDLGDDTTASNDPADRPDSIDDAGDDAAPVLLDTTAMVDEDWYSITIESDVPVFGTIPTSDIAGDLDAFLYSIDDFAVCGEVPSTPHCDSAGQIFTSTRDLVDACGDDDDFGCGVFSRLEPVALDPGEYLVRVEYTSMFDPADPTSYTLDIVLSPETLGACIEQPEANGCSQALDIVEGLYDFNSGCDAAPSPVCSAGALGLPEENSLLGTLMRDIADEGSASSSAPGNDAGDGTVASAPRTFAITPGTDPGHLELTETGPNTGIFRITDAVYYSASIIEDYMRSVLNGLPPGSVVQTDNYSIRFAPDGTTVLLRDGGGAAYTFDQSTGAPPEALVPLEANIDDPNFTVLTGPGGLRVVIPSPFATVVDVSADPDAIATTAEDITTAKEAGDGLVGIITSSGGSTGPVFDLGFVNLGKPAVIQGDAIFEPLTDAEAAAAKSALAGLMDGVNTITNGPGTAYCAEQDNVVPSAGQLFRFANAGKQRQLGFATQVLDGARRVESAGLLNPDSDPTAYMHSTRQWAIWTVEKQYDKQGFTDSFLEHSRKVLEQGGTQWSSQVEEAVRGLVDNRWADIRKVLDAAGLATPGQDSAADLPPHEAALGLLVAALVALFSVRHVDRATEKLHQR